MRLPKFIKKIIGCTDNESSRYALGGVKCEFNGEQSTCVATDGRKLIAVTYADDSGGESFDAIVDGKALSKAVTAVTSGKNTYATVAHDNGAVRVAGVVGLTSLRPTGATATASIVDGRYPGYKDVFGIYDEPADNYAVVKLDPALMAELLAVYSAAQSESNRGVYLWVNKADCTKPTYMHMQGEDGELIRSVLCPLAADDGSTRACSEYPHPLDKAAPQPEPTVEEPEQDGPVVGGGPPECLDDDTIAAAVTAEPEPVGAGAFGSWIPPVS